MLQVKADQLDITIVKGHTEGSSLSSSTTTSTAASPASANGPGPCCRFVNVALCGTIPQGGVKGSQGTVLLENPQGDFPISVAELRHQVLTVL